MHGCSWGGCGGGGATRGKRGRHGWRWLQLVCCEGGIGVELCLNGIEARSECRKRAARAVSQLGERNEGEDGQQALEGEAQKSWCPDSAWRPVPNHDIRWGHAKLTSLPGDGRPIWADAGVLSVNPPHPLDIGVCSKVPRNAVFG